MKIEIKTITPDLAKQLLANNFQNRKLNQYHLNTLISAMKAGNWKENGEAIKFSNTGKLLDGQHRLTAIAESNTAQELVIISELEDSVFDTIDTGKPRTNTDFLYIEQIPNAAVMSSILSYINVFEAGLDLTAGASKVVRTASLILERYKSNPDYYNSLASLAKRYYKVCSFLTPAEYGLIYHVLAKKSSQCAEEFLDKLSTGTNLNADDPIYVLRQRLFQYKTGKLNPSIKLKLGLVFVAWNFYRKGTNVQRLRFNANSDEYPKIL